MQYPSTSAAEPQAVLSFVNGDVWVGRPDLPGGRRFRSVFGHVVEVLDDGRVRRVGAQLSYAQPWLLVNAPLERVIERALGSDPEG
ncbi:hypothetical protein HLB44_00705 [Aquincola sp. S2]|uniref:Uncharacterized protein n=1 Tax=Pseudaquabacterium terrae TaxID=2732868 RepID=A0ABX2ECH1_9BURK|nr:hypothetical protein [Aquabacterium terrae]NRF65492.1 hypothetical protein [Aquabacterium terrae]